MSNDRSTMGGGTAEQLQLAMRRQHCKTIAANAKTALWEFGILDLCVFWIRSQLVKSCDWT
jgi:hypothetical protein